jgi:hypothetical protein
MQDLTLTEAIEIISENGANKEVALVFWDQMFKSDYMYKIGAIINKTEYYGLVEFFDRTRPFEEYKQFFLDQAMIRKYGYEAVFNQYPKRIKSYAL